MLTKASPYLNMLMSVSRRSIIASMLYDCPPASPACDISLRISAISRLVSSAISVAAETAALAFSLASPLLAARPVVETERMMNENAYQGVWLEKHHDEALKVAFSTNGWMIVDYRGCPQLFKWKSNGKGLI